MPKESLYHDITITGEENPDGSCKELLEDDALKNALLLWLISKRGEFLKNPGDGGLLDSLMFKTIDENRIQQVAFSIKTSIFNNFFPALRLTDLQITPEYELRAWKIEITFQSPISGASQTAILYTRDLSTTPSFIYEEVDYEDDNLINFIKLKKIDMKKKLVIYNSDFGCFTWGKYKLINLTPTSSNLSEVLELANLS